MLQPLVQRQEVAALLLVGQVSAAEATLSAASAARARTLFVTGAMAEGEGGQKWPFDVVRRAYERAR